MTPLPTKDMAEGADIRPGLKQLLLQDYEALSDSRDLRGWEVTVIFKTTMLRQTMCLSHTRSHLRVVLYSTVARTCDHTSIHVQEPVYTSVCS